MATEHLMDPSALHPEPLEPLDAWVAGTVTHVLDDRVTVVRDGCASSARRAASCLLAPREGDTVLIARAEGELFVLAVLEARGEARDLDVEGDLRIRSRDGAITIEAHREVRLRTPGSVTAAAGTVAIVGRQVRWAADQLELFSESLSIDAGRIRQVASFAESILESVKETLGTSYREIRDSEHVRARSLSWSVQTALRAHADTVIVTAKKLVKMNADQIHLG